MGLTVTRLVSRTGERVTFPAIDPRFLFRQPSVAQDVVRTTASSPDSMPCGFSGRPRRAAEVGSSQNSSSKTSRTPSPSVEKSTFLRDATLTPTSNSCGPCRRVGACLHRSTRGPAPSSMASGFRSSWGRRGTYRLTWSSVPTTSGRVFASTIECKRPTSTWADFGSGLRSIAKPPATPSFNTIRPPTSWISIFASGTTSRRGRTCGWCSMRGWLAPCPANVTRPLPSSGAIRA